MCQRDKCLDNSRHVVQSSVFQVNLCMYPYSSQKGTARVFSAATRKCITKLEGHEGEISKVSCFLIWSNLFTSKNSMFSVSIGTKLLRFVQLSHSF